MLSGARARHISRLSQNGNGFVLLLLLLLWLLLCLLLLLFRFFIVVVLLLLCSEGRGHQLLSIGKVRTALALTMTCQARTHEPPRLPVAPGCGPVL